MKALKKIAMVKVMMVVIWIGVAPGMIDVNQLYAAETIVAGSCNNTFESPHVQIAIDQAQNGDTVAMPPGNCTWSKQVVMNKAIRLTGAGATQTIITEQCGLSGEMKGALRSAYGSMPSEREIDNFALNAALGGASGSQIRIEGTGRFRVHHMKGIGRAIWLSTDPPTGGQYGLIDNCHITASVANAELIHVGSNRDASWSADSTYGTTGAVYIEDCTFTKATGVAANVGHAVAGYGGGRYVFRYNTLWDMDVDAHGFCGNVVSTRHTEIYENDFYGTLGKNRDKWIYLRGGSGRVWNNRLHYGGSYGTINNKQIVFSEYQLAAGNGSGIVCRPTDCPKGWPAHQQIGRGKNDTSEPYYIYNNTANGVVTGVSCQMVGEKCSPGTTCANYMQAGRDYFVNSGPPPGYTPLTYPHPLRGEQAFKALKAPDNSLKAPANLRIYNQ